MTDEEMLAAYRDALVWAESRLQALTGGKKPTLAQLLQVTRELLSGIQGPPPTLEQILADHKRMSELHRKSRH